MSEVYFPPRTSELYSRCYSVDWAKANTCTTCTGTLCTFLDSLSGHADFMSPAELGVKEIIPRFPNRNSKPEWRLLWVFSYWILRVTSWFQYTRCCNLSLINARPLAISTLQYSCVHKIKWAPGVLSVLFNFFSPITCMQQALDLITDNKEVFVL